MILEKAFAKVKGAYAKADAGYVDTGIRSLTGAPNFWITDIAESDVDDAWALVKAGDEAGYIMAAETAGYGDDSVSNHCGIAQSHAYAMIAAF